VTGRGKTDVSRAGGPAIEIRTDVEPAEWDAYVDRASEASVYHRSAWAPVMREVFGHEVRCLAATQGARVVGVLPLVFFRSPLFGRFAVSMPFLNYGGVVADDEASRGRLLEAAVGEARARRARYVELRHVRRHYPGLAVRSHKVAMTLALGPSVEEQWSALDRKLRNQVRKAEKSGLTAVSGGVDLLDGFHDVLARNMRDLGTPVHGRRFFAAVLDAFPNETRVFAIRHEGRAVAASLVIWHREGIEVPWASSLRAYNPLCANVLLYWHMLRFAIDRGLMVFDFGRSTPGEGTYQFKKQWGAVATPLHWEYWADEGVALPDRSPTNARFSAAIALWRRLPLAVTRAIGPRIVREIP